MPDAELGGNQGYLWICWHAMLKPVLLTAIFSNLILLRFEVSPVELLSFYHCLTLAYLTLLIYPNDRRMH